MRFVQPANMRQPRKNRLPFAVKQS